VDARSARPVEGRDKRDERDKKEGRDPSESEKTDEPLVESTAGDFSATGREARREATDEAADDEVTDANETVFEGERQSSEGRID